MPACASTGHRLPELFCGFRRRARRGADALSGGLRAAGVGGRRRLHAAGRMPRSDIDAAARRVWLRRSMLDRIDWIRFTNISSSMPGSTCSLRDTRTMSAFRCSGVKEMFRFVREVIAGRSLTALH